MKRLNILLTTILTLLITGTLLLCVSHQAVWADSGPDIDMDDRGPFTDLEKLDTCQAATPLFSVSETQRWDIECVDCPKYFDNMTDRSLRLDAEGNPHVAYGGDHLYYAWHDGSQWHYETVDHSPGVGEYASMTLDKDDRAHISYYDVACRDLKHAHYVGPLDTNWYVYLTLAIKE